MSQQTQNRSFTKLSHQFAHRRKGAQYRFLKEYIELRDQVQTAWLADLANMEARARSTMSSNQALAKTRLSREIENAREQARSTVRMVFDRYRQELERIAGELGGHPQEDGNVVFPDGSTATMSRSLFIPKEEMLTLEYVAV